MRSRVKIKHKENIVKKSITFGTDIKLNSVQKVQVQSYSFLHLLLPIIIGVIITITIFKPYKSINNINFLKIIQQFQNDNLIHTSKRMNVSIQTLDWSNDTDFLLSIIKIKRPILIHNAPMISDWNIFSKEWNLSTLDYNNNINLLGTRMQYNDSTFVLRHERDKGGMLNNMGIHGNHLSYINISLFELVSNISSNNYLYWTGELLEFEQLINKKYSSYNNISSTGTKSKNYNDGWSILRIIDEGLELSMNLSDLSQWRPMIWISHPLVTAQTHYDTQHNLFLQISGTKTFQFYSPDNELYCYPNLHRSYRQSQLVHDDDFMNKSFSQYYEVEVNPGDLLYIPPFWYHRVKSNTFSVSLSVLSPSLLEAIIAEAYWQPVPFGQYKDSLELRTLAISILISNIFDSLNSLNDSLSLQNDSTMNEKYYIIQIFSYNLYQSRYSIIYKPSKFTKIKTKLCQISIDESLLKHKNITIQNIINTTSLNFQQSANKIVNIIHSIDNIVNQTNNYNEILLNYNIANKIKETFLRDYIEQIVRWAVGIDDTPMYIYKCLAKRL